MIEPLQQNLKMKQGSLFLQPLNVVDNGAVVVLTGYSARMQIREYKDSTDILAEYTDATPAADGAITILASAGQVVIKVPGTASDDYDWGDAWYDLEIVSPTDGPICVMEGRISLVREVTR
jgi:hypothetical protein